MVNGEVRRIYDNNYLYIRDIDPIVSKEKELNANNTNRVLDGFDFDQPQPVASSGVMGPGVPGVSVGPAVSVVPTVSIVPGVPMGPGVSGAPVLPGLPGSPGGTFGNFPHPSLGKVGRFYGSNIHGTISPSEQSVRVASGESINLLEEPLSIQLPSSLGSQTALCGIFINNQIALGLKDGVIQVLSCDGHAIATLREHKANICTLAIARFKNQNLLVSGGDVGCGKVIAWDPVAWMPKAVLGGHTTAVTGIVDLQDDTHILSAGYDKKLNVYSLEQGKQVFSAPQSESPITALAINKTGNKVIGCGLEKALYVWGVVRDYRLKT
jgi:WD40 repeat protein